MTDFARFINWCVCGVPAGAILLFLPLQGHCFCFDRAASDFGISPALLKGIARVESGFDAKAVNSNRNGTSDFGLMQINSFWLSPLGLSAQQLLDDPCLNARTGARILRDCIDRYGYGWEAVGCYNASSKGKRSKYAWKVFQQLKKDERKASAKFDAPVSTEPHVQKASFQFEIRDSLEE